MTLPRRWLGTSALPVTLALASVAASVLHAKSAGWLWGHGSDGAAALRADAERQIIRLEARLLGTANQLQSIEDM